MSAERTEKLIELDREHIVHPMLSVGKEPPIIVEKAHGIMLQDTEGKQYIDLMAQLVNLNLGHGRQEIIDAATRQLKELQHGALYFGMGNPSNIECARSLAEITPPGVKHFFFASGGSEANELAFRMARSYWQHQGKNKFKIISLYNAYHGISYGSMSATGTGKGRSWEGFYPTVPGFIHIPPFYCYRCYFDMKYPDCDIKCARFLAKIIENEGQDSVAAFIAEPAQGSGGVIPPPPEYWPIVREICTRYDVLLIADEVMTGFGRTGKLFALEHWGVTPDMMTMSKGINAAYLPLGALAMNDSVYDGLKGLSMSGYSHGGNPAASAAAVKAIEIYGKEKIAENAAKVGKHALERLQAEFEPLPCVGDVRGLGLLIGMEIVADKTSKTMISEEQAERLQERARQNGLLLRFPGYRALFVTPPLTITIEEMDKALDILKPLVAELKPD